jgi:hypothetical protein
MGVLLRDLEPRFDRNPPKLSGMGIALYHVATIAIMSNATNVVDPSNAVKD